MEQRNKSTKDKNFNKKRILGNRDYYYDAEIGEIPGETAQRLKSSERAEDKAQKILKRYEDNDIKSI